MKRIFSVFGFIIELIGNLVPLAIILVIVIGFWKGNKAIAVVAPGWYAEVCLKERWEELAKENPVLAHTKFVSAEISGGKMDKEKGGTPVRGTFKLIIGDTVKEYPVAGFVSSEKGTVSLDLSQAKARLAGDVAEGMTGADVKKFLVSEYSAATGLDERSSATLRYLLHKTDDEFFEKIAPRSARRTK